MAQMSMQVCMYLQIPQHVSVVVVIVVVFCLFVCFLFLFLFFIVLLYPALDFFESSDHGSDIDQPQPPPHTDWTDVCIRM